jgi:hypothetical protein
MPYVVTFLAYIYMIIPTPNYSVTQSPEAVSYYSMAQASYQSDVLLAHEHLAGAAFSELQPGDLVQAGFPDGMRLYQVTEVQRYIATDPFSIYSYFIAENGTSFGSWELGKAIYDGGHGLILQTCFDESKGRLFVIAEPAQVDDVR